MQNITIPVTTPAVSAQTPTVATDDGTSPTETFGNVLARQLADSAQPAETNTADTGLPTTSATDNILTVTSNNEKSIEPQAPTPGKSVV